MLNVKERVRRMLDQLPDDCSVEDIQHQLYLIEKVQRGLKSIDEGKGIEHDQVKQQFAKWATE